MQVAGLRLLRHQDTRTRATRTGARRSALQLLRAEPQLFEHYQRGQDAALAAQFNGTCWADFVVAPERAVLFVGLYRVPAREHLSSPFLRHSDRRCPLPARWRAIRLNLPTSLRIYAACRD
jgi:hypothetical protein